MRKLLLVGLLLLTSACAWTPDAVPVQRQAVPVAMVPGAAGISVAVTASDARQEREISHKKNGYGMRGADISATNDIVEEVRLGVREMLNGQGFRDGRDATLRIEVSRFYNTFDMGFWSATANSQAIATLQLTSADGRNLYSRVYTSNHQLPGVQIMTADNAGASLRSALHGLLRQIADDPQLTRALLQAQPAPTIVAPQPSEPSRSGRPRVGA